MAKNVKAAKPLKPKRVNPTTYMALTAVSVVAGVGLCGMTWSSLGDEQMKLASLEKEVRNETELTTELTETQHKIEATKLELKHLESGISDIAYIPTMLIELQKVCRETGINDLAVRPLPEPPKDPKKKEERKLWQQIDLEVSGTGDYPSVLKLMDTLKQFPKIVGVKEVSLLPKIDQGPEPTGLVTATIKISAYAFKEKATEKKLENKTNEGLNNG